MCLGWFFVALRSRGQQCCSHNFAHLGWSNSQTIWEKTVTTRTCSVFAGWTAPPSPWNHISWNRHITYITWSTNEKESGGHRHHLAENREPGAQPTWTLFAIQLSEQLQWQTAAPSDKWVHHRVLAASTVQGYPQPWRCLGWLWATNGVLGHGTSRRLMFPVTMFRLADAYVIKRVFAEYQPSQL